MTRLHTAALALLLAAAAGPGLAHTGPGDVAGVSSGFGHPFGGLDHMLAMVAVGLLGVQLGGRSVWLVPAAFLAMMLAGGAIGLAGSAGPIVEIGIAGSTIVLGAVIALGRHIPLSVTTGLTGVFGLCHGHAHGTEMPAALSGLDFATGFIAATLLLHAAGFGLGLSARALGRRTASLLVRTAGGTIAVVGTVTVVL